MPLRIVPFLLPVACCVAILLFARCKTQESKGTSVAAETPRYLRLNYDVVYDTSEGATLFGSGKLFARGLFYDFQIHSSKNKFERIRASSYTEDNQIDFKYILNTDELGSLKNKQYQYFSMPNDSRAGVMTGLHEGNCYIRWEWQKESFVFVFETDVKNESGESQAALGKEFHENIRKGLRIF
ncbi:hypothetical protein EHQ12_18445 [Leptospira gomenensis]|uniref:Uncharacterized protein n=1 Tax=Leptospira gomenensis TaxID=2484974 RepID=A0A5F1YFA2_9LEPT|nr:hypothetical protein EHQ12_18445 [Leptospira gomenensis]TGK38496.1 hypothetical protein EHQ17_01320 [Leptospira gomenensis]TGK52255.1 hypothetical protein EHQ07_00745 [Leptospira gomenensis]TGK59924.1 hypothetical protein EHQ13_11310 [Leptospira gomenensis]